MIALAHVIIRTAFAGKVDKAGKPYINHLLRVEDAVRHLGEVVRCIALLHDLLEDCHDWTPERLLEQGFSSEVVQGVIAMTKGKDEPYADFIERLSTDPNARAVKLADLKDNMDVSRLEELTDKDVERLRKYQRAYKFLSA